MSERFNKVKPLYVESFGEKALVAQVTKTNDGLIDIDTDISGLLDVADARALRDWLNRAIPDQAIPSKGE